MGWRSETRDIIRRYPQHLRDETVLRTVSVTASVNGGRGSHNVSRTTELAAIRELPPDEQRELDAVRQAIATTMRYRNGDDRIRLIDLMYWRAYGRSMWVAADEVHVSYGTAKNWHNGFIELVDAYMRVM